MSEKAKGFKVGDKVFGKVKGYPAWPARISSLNGKRYGVIFYGTNETATLKQDDIYYYLSNKNKFPKQKRKYYAEAVIDIESDIENCGGSDGNDNPPDENDEELSSTPKGGNKRKRTSTAPKKTTDAAPAKNKKRKLEDQNHNFDDSPIEDSQTDEQNSNKSITTESSQSKSQSTLDAFLKIDNESSATNNTQNASEAVADKEMDVDLMLEATEDDSGVDIKAEKIADEEAMSQENVTEQSEEPTIKAADDNEQVNNVDNKETSNLTENNAIEDAKEEVAKIEEPRANPFYEGEISVKDLNLLPDFYFTAITLYAQRVQDNSHYYKINKPDPVSLDNVNDIKLKVLPVKLETDKYCGLIYAPKTIDSYKCEFDRAMDDARIVQELLELKAEVNVGNLTQTDPRFIKSLDCDDAYVQEATNLPVVAYKKAKLEWLQREMTVFKLHLEIKKCLGMHDAKPEQALAHMQTILGEPIAAISLKKRAFFVDTVVRLCKYVGNKQDWTMDETQEAAFEATAAQIRHKADEILDKIRQLFSYGDKADEFVENFEKDCEEFQETTKYMTEAEVFSLCADPWSRKAQLELIFDEQANQEESNEADVAAESMYTPD